MFCIELPPRPAKRGTSVRAEPAAAAVDAVEVEAGSGGTAAEGARTTRWGRASGGNWTLGAPIVIEYCDL